MTKEEDYRENAAETLDLARRAGTLRKKRRLLALVEKWLDLADRASQLTSRLGRKTQPDHPAVVKKLGSGSTHAD
jgi:hypothetical protein